MDKLQTIRKLVQSAFFVKFVVLSALYSASFCLCIFGYLQRFTLIKNVYIVPTVIIVSVLTIIFGRVFCGWVCPLGFIFDLTYRLRIKLFGLRKLPEVSPSIHNKLIYIKYIILIIFIILTYHFTTYAYCSVCPIGALTNLSGTVISYIFLIGFIILGFIYPMAFCRYFCPIGALLGILSIKPLFKLELNDNCVKCKLCEKKCPMQINITENIAQKECIRCFECISNCKKNAISYIPMDIIASKKK